MAAAAAKTDSMCEAGLVSMTGTFFRPCIIACTMTGLALILAGAWQTDLSGAAMTAQPIRCRFECRLSLG